MEGVAAATPITKANTANTAMITSGIRFMVAPFRDKRVAYCTLRVNNLQDRLSSVRWVTLAKNC
jgi:hypothetical protein